ncbi:hypothetical protein HAX54_026060 [Datura stramonium]|uniref:Uncharacterized protein n=1 Tax=Datura stramonium TaxID=4076 RepID=A0ABS8V0Y0_DATST|nr:hypothetical protein [Datura stramonium]
MDYIPRAVPIPPVQMQPTLPPPMPVTRASTTQEKIPAQTPTQIDVLALPMDKVKALAQETPSIYVKLSNVEGKALKKKIAASRLHTRGVA